MGLLNIFKKRNKNSANYIHFHSNFNRIKNDVILSIAHLVGKNLGKLNPLVLKDGVMHNDNILELLQSAPCPYLTAYDFFYKIGYDLIMHGNFYARIIRDNKSRVKGFAPISGDNVSLSSCEDDYIFSYYDRNINQNIQVPYFDIIHIKNSFTDIKFFADSPSQQIQSSMSMLDDTYKGIKNAIINNVSLRGYLHMENSFDEEDMQKTAENFKNAYFTTDNAGGIAVLDNTATFHELNSKTQTVPIEQVEFFKNNILEYFGINNRILRGEYSVEEWTAFYETTIEPIVINMSQEFTNKLYDVSSHIKIVFDSKRLENATPTLRLNIATALFDRGAITLNEFREILYHSHLDDEGDERYISLNYVNTQDQSEYQVGKERESGK